MLRSDSFIAKMSESNILNQYSKYLQLALFSIDADKLLDESRALNFLLTYEEFREYYILSLVGKDNFLDDKVRELQFPAN